MKTSIRTRLLVWVIGGMAILLAAFAAAAYGLLSESLRHDFDTLLASSARSISASTEQDKERIRVEIAEREFQEFFRERRPDYFQVWSEEGLILARSSSLHGSDLERFSGASGALTFRRVRLPDGRAGRAVSFLFTPKSDEEAESAAAGKRVLLVVAKETGALDGTIEKLQILLVMTAAGTLVFAFAVGFVIVRRGLRPLESLATRIASIGADDLSARIEANDMPAELAPVAQRLNGLLLKLDEAFLRERSFTADAAHELRTPLAGIRSSMEVALSRPRPAADYRDTLVESLQIVRHMEAMVANLLALARLDGRQTPLHPEAQRLNDLVEAGRQRLEAETLARAVTIENRIPADLTCNADRDCLTMILSNLLANAVEYVDEHGRIEMAAKQSGSFVELTVSNSGCRLAEDDVKHVFDRFWRADAARTGTGIHCGLGLTLVRRAVEAQGGTASAQVSGGTFRVRVTLPHVS